MLPLPQLVLTLTSTAALLPVQRHVGRWTAPPRRVPTAMMFDSPIVANGDAGLTFGGPPEHTTFYASSNSFWSANQVVDAPPQYTQHPGGAESYTQVRIGDVQLSVPALKGGSYAAAQDLYHATVNATYVAPACTLSHESFVARAESQDNLAITRLVATGVDCGNATITLRSWYLAGKYGPTHAAVQESSSTLTVSRHSVTTRHSKLTAAPCFIAGQQADSQRWIATNGTAIGSSSGLAKANKLRLVDGRCIRASTRTPNLALTIGDCAAEDSGGAGSGWHLLPMGPGGVAPPAPPPSPGPSPALPPAPAGYVAMPGYVGGQHRDPPTHVPGTPASRCCNGTLAACVQQAASACSAQTNCTSFGLFHSCRIPGKPANGWMVEVFTAAMTKGSFLDAGWNSWRKQSAAGPPTPTPATQPAGMVLVDATGGCAGLDPAGNFLIPASCHFATRWGIDDESKHLYSLAAGEHRWGSGRCLTAVEPNPVVVAAMALRVVDSAGARVPLGGAPTTDATRSSTITLDLNALRGQTLTILTAILTQGNCTGCNPDVSDVITDGITDVELSAVDLLDYRAKDIAHVASVHQEWWHSYWSQGAQIDLGSQWQRLEGFYYGMHYQIGSASRANRFAPGLWGPWITDETCGWSGDYTLNYNFEANYYGVFSDNRPELVQPYFQTILNQVDLGKWRASMPFWGSGTSSATPGFWAQDFNHMSDLATNKSFPFVQAGYDGVQFPTHFSPWKHFYFVSDWGQKNVGAFTTKAFMDYYDYTLNITFLRQTLYPLTKLNGAFYASYMTKIGGKYNVMHSCAMEGCGAQGPLTGKNIAVSNNPPFDLAFVKRTFRGLLEYSKTLGVDSHMRAQWQTYLENVAEYPLTKDENGNTVFAQATLNGGPTSTATDGFPNASKCQWNPVVNGGGEGPKCGPCAMHCPNKSATPVGGCSYPCKTGSGDPQTCCAPCHHSASDDRIAVQSTSDCGNARYPITFFNAIHPGEDVDLASDATILAIARSTTSVVNAINDYSPTNGLCMAWPSSARVVKSTSQLLGHFDTALNHTMMNNFIPFIDNRPTGGSGCNIENSGATVAVNDLLASVHGHGTHATLRLFPGGWPVDQVVSFRNIRVRGSFTVSAAAVGRASGQVALSGDVSITSLAGAPLTIRWPVTGHTPTVKSPAGVSMIKVAPGVWRFNTTSETTYIVS